MFGQIDKNIVEEEEVSEERRRFLQDDAVENALEAFPVVAAPFVPYSSWTCTATFENSLDNRMKVNELTAWKVVDIVTTRTFTENLDSAPIDTEYLNDPVDAGTKRTYDNDDLSSVDKMQNF